MADTIAKGEAGSSISKEDILEAVSHMSVMDLCDLVEAMEKKFGVSAAPIAAAPVAAAATEAAAEEQTEFDVLMTSYGSNKISVIKEVRAITGLNLKEAKELTEKVDQAPATIKPGITKEEAEALKKQLEEVGAQVDLK